MALVPAICTQCGAQIEVDNTHEAGICKFCGTPFITEKAINQYSTVHNVTQNITKIIYGNEKDEASDYFLRGVTQLKIENWVEAYKAFNKACKIAPQVAKYWLYSVIAQTKNLTSFNEICLDEDRDIYCGGTRIAAAIKSFSKLAYEVDFSLAKDEFGLSLYSDFKRNFVSFVVRILTNDEYDNDEYSTNIFIGNASQDAKYQNFANDLVDVLLKVKFDGKRAFRIIKAISSGCDVAHVTAFKTIAIPCPDENGTIDITTHNIDVITTLENIVVGREEKPYKETIRVLDMHKLDLTDVKCIRYNEKYHYIDKVIYCDAKGGRRVKLDVNLSILDVSAVGNRIDEYSDTFWSVRFDEYHPLVVVSGKFNASKPINLNAPPYTIVYSKDGGEVNFVSYLHSARLGYLSDGVLHNAKLNMSDQKERNDSDYKFERNIKYYFLPAMKEGKVRRPGVSKLKSFLKNLLS